MSNKQSDFLWIDFIADVILDLIKDGIPSALLAVTFIGGWNNIAVKALPTITQPLAFSDIFFNVWMFCYLCFSITRFAKKYQD